MIKETWNDRSDVQVDNGMHKSDTMEEKLSLVNRFGVTINYSKPSQKEFFNIAVELCRRAGVTMSDEEIKAEANKWEAMVVSQEEQRNSLQTILQDSRNNKQ